MSCASGSCSATGQCFSRFSNRYAKRFRTKGLEKAQQGLLEGIRREGTGWKNILDIGCGVGALHLTLPKEGAERATAVDGSEGMLNQARQFAREFGLNDKTSYHLGDFVELSAGLPEADVTFLDKVVCCYEDLDMLIEHSTRKTKSLYAITYPRNNLLVEFSFRIQIFFLKLFRARFHPFWHDWRRMRESILARGFHPVYEKPTLLWNIVIFRRAA